mgnify:CR=1 FL=1
MVGKIDRSCRDCSPSRNRLKRRFRTPLQGEVRSTLDLRPGERFVVKAEGDVDINTLRGAVSSLDLPKLESMKGAGVSK